MARQSTGTVVEYDTKGGRGYALRFRAGGKRRYLTLGTDAEGWGRQRAEEELAYVLAQVRRGTWQPPKPAPLMVEVEDPSFHEFASEWLEAVSPGLAAKTQERYRWQLTDHLLPFFHRHRLSEITVAEVDRYRDAKQREARARRAALDAWREQCAALEPGKRRPPRPARPLSPDTINGTLTRLGQILDVADERSLVDRNPLRVNPRRRKLKASRPRAVWLDGAGQLRALLDAAGELDAEARADRQRVGRRAMLTTMALGGLRVGELCALRWRAVDLAAGRLNVGDAKTDAGRRYIDLLAPLRSALAVHKAATKGARPADYVFPTAKGNARTINNVRERVFNPAVKRANANLERDELGTCL